MILRGVEERSAPAMPKSVPQRLGRQAKTSLSDAEMAGVAIAYDTGCDGRDEATCGQDGRAQEGARQAAGAKRAATRKAVARKAAARKAAARKAPGKKRRQEASAEGTPAKKTPAKKTVLERAAKKTDRSTARGRG
jgi:hypothetical protein